MKCNRTICPCWVQAFWLFLGQWHVAYQNLFYWYWTQILNSLNYESGRVLEFGPAKAFGKDPDTLS